MTAIESMRAGRKCKALGFALIASTSMLAIPARAQSTPATSSDTQPATSPATSPAASPAPSPAASPEPAIVVTAERRTERLIDVPTSISVVSAQTIKNDTMISLSDIAGRVPNVSMSGSSLFPNITIRGVGSSSGTQTGVDPAAVVYVDGVYQGRERAENLPLIGIQQVEVLRGPQGTLYGENTIGGAINITTVKPSDELVANGDLLFGNLGLVQGSALVSGPLNPSGANNLFASINVMGRTRNGFIHNDFNNSGLNYDRAKSARVRIVYEPTSRFSLDLSADYLHENDSESLLTISYAPLPFPPYNTIPPLKPHSRSESLDSPEDGRRTVYGASLNAEYDFDAMKLVSISSYRAYKSHYEFDSDGTPLPIDAEQDTDNAKLFTEELRLMSTGRGPLKWIAGAYYSHQNLYDNFNNIFLPDFPLPLLGGPPLPSDYFNEGYSRGRISSNEYAAFLNLTYDITPRWVLNAGFRYTHDQKHLVYSQQTTTVTGFPLAITDLVLVPIPLATSHQSASVPTGDISLSYKFTRNQVGYIKFSRGYKAGGFNAYLITPPFDPATESFAFRPEYLNNYEAGFKGSWWGGRLTFNGDVFYDRYTDKQEAIEDPILLSIVIRNAARATIYGAEMDMAIQPVQGLTLSGSLGLLHATYGSFPDAGAANACNCYTGNALPLAPHFQGSFAAQYAHRIPRWPGWNGFVRGEVTHQSGAYSDPNNTVAYFNDPVTYLNARAGVENDHWGFYLWGKNLTNVYHLTGGLYELVSTARAVNMPRTFGGDITFKF